MLFLKEQKEQECIQNCSHETERVKEGHDYQKIIIIQKNTIVWNFDTFNEEINQDNVAGFNKNA